MSNTREEILKAALTLFASRGYEAVSVSDIAGELSITKGALYRHFESKQAIFDEILLRMEQSDTNIAEDNSVPLEGEESHAGIHEIISFSKAMLRYWTQDGFARSFRRMITIEQYRSEELMRLYHQYLGQGPVDYVEMMLRALGYSDAESMARSLYSVMRLCFSLCDISQDAEHEIALTEQIMDEMEKQWANSRGSGQSSGPGQV